MKRNVKKTFLAAALLIALPSLLSPAASAAGEAGPETLSLKPLIEEALANNPEIIAQRETVRSKEARTRAEGALEDPTLKVEMEDLSKDRPLNIAPGNAMLTRYTLSQAFPFPGKRPLKERMAYKEALASRSALRAKELEIAFRLKEAYFDYAFLGEAIRGTVEIKEIVSGMTRIAEARYSTGLVPQQDVIKAQAESTMLSNELITLEARREIAAARLKSVLNRDQSSPIGPPGELPKERYSFDAERLIRTAVPENPEVKTAEFEAEASELGAELAGKNYYPDFMVGIAPIQRDGRFDSYDLMFQVNIPIWRNKYDSLYREASSAARAMRHRASSERNIKALDIREAATEAESAGRMSLLYETALVPQVELSFQSALKNYQSGKVDFLTLLDAEREVKKTRIEYLKTVLEYRKRLASLERAAGYEIALRGADSAADNTERK